MAETKSGRKPTVEEAEAMLTLVRGGWLKVELTLDMSVGREHPDWFPVLPS